MEKKKNRISIVVIVALFCAMAGIAFIAGMNADSENEEPNKIGQFFDVIWDENATEGGWDQKSEDEIQSELNAKVAEGMINMSMNTSPYFVNGKAQGNLMIVNETINRYPQVVQIFRNDTNELIYTSAMIPVGSKIEADTLDVELSSGLYPCTAMFHSVDPTTGAVLGSAGMIINLTVKD